MFVQPRSNEVGMNFSDNGIRFSVKFYVKNHILDIFFEPVDVKNLKTDQFLKWELTWEIEKSI